MEKVGLRTHDDFVDLELMLTTFDGEVCEVFRVEAAKSKVRGGVDACFVRLTDLARPSLREALTVAMAARQRKWIWKEKERVRRTVNERREAHFK